MLAAIIEEQRLRAALALVITGAHPDGIHIPPVVLLLWMRGRVTINCGDGSSDVLCLHPLGQTQLVDCSVHAHLSGLYRVKLIMDRGSGTGQIINLIHLNIERETDVVAHELKKGVTQQMLPVVSRSSVEIIHAQDFVAPLKQSFAQM